VKRKQEAEERHAQRIQVKEAKAIIIRLKKRSLKEDKVDQS
jgi:hypothetical protein